MGRRGVAHPFDVGVGRVWYRIKCMSRWESVLNYHQRPVTCMSVIVYHLHTDNHLHRSMLIQQAKVTL